MAAETPPLPQTDWMRKQARTAPRDPSFPAEKDADAETATAAPLFSIDPSATIRRSGPSGDK